VAPVSAFQENLYSGLEFIWLRVTGKIGATVCFLSALANIPLANVTAILQALPLAITMVQPFFLVEL
jgi:drug/metabolite transporter (DMT)-like permease